jgi:fatty acid desaturase/SAM-dependent methyltransferase
VIAAAQSASPAGRVALLEADELKRLARVSDVRGLLDQAVVWGAILASVWLAARLDHWLATLLAVIVIGSRQNALATLAHEAWHRLALSDGRWNHRVGAWLDSYPIGIAYHHDRRRHMRHHREVGLAHDPDWVNYTIEGRETPPRLARYLLSLLCGLLFVSTAWSVLVERRPRIAVSDDDAPRETGSMPSLREELLGIVVCQAVLLVLFTAIGGFWAYPLYWCLPLATFAGFFANLRAFLEHAAARDDVAPEVRLRDFEVGRVEAFLLSPCHFNYHALHHAYLAIPHRNLPLAKRLLLERHAAYPLPVQRGYVRSLLQHVASMQQAPVGVAVGSGGARAAATAEPVRRDDAWEGREPEPRVIVACEVCGTDQVRPVTGWLKDEESFADLPPRFRDLEFRFVRCIRCGLVYMRERPSPADLDVFYGEAYKCFESYADRGAIMNALAKLVARGKLEQIRRYMPPGNRRLLDYGCGAGTWLDLMQGMGCDLEMIGMDVTEGPLEELRRRGVAAYCCDERTMFEHVAPGSVGVIHLFHVIEHVPDTGRVLEALHRALAPGGVVIGQTPNLASTGCRFWGDLWNQWHVPRHLVLFSDDTLRRRAEMAGFEVVEIKSSLSGATQWALSALHWWAKRRGRTFRNTHEPLYPPLILACLPIALLESALSRTCHMDFVLRKPVEPAPAG